MKKIHNHLHLYIFNLPWFIWEKVSILIPRPPPPTSNLFFFFFPSAYNHYLLQQPAGNCFFAFIDKSSTGQRSIATTAVKSTTPPYLVTKWTSITPSISTSFIFYFISFFFFILFTTTSITAMTDEKGVHSTPTPQRTQEFASTSKFADSNLQFSVWLLMPNILLLFFFLLTGIPSLAKWFKYRFYSVFIPVA